MLTTKTVKLQDIEEANSNPREHAEDKIIASIARFGYVNPVIVDGRTNRLVAGHGRLTALKAMFESKEEPPSGIEVKDGEWHIPVVMGWSSKDDIEAKAYLVADNRLTELGGWDNGLESLLTDISKEDSDLLEIIGYESTIDIPSDFSLDDGEIEEKDPMKKITVFIPSGSNRLQEVIALVDSIGGMVIK